VVERKVNFPTYQIPAHHAAKSLRAPVPLSQLKKLKAVIFDLDGVVVDSERAHLLTFNAALAPLGVRISERFWKKNYTGIGSVAIIEDIFARNAINGSVREMVEKRASIYQKHIEKHGLPQIEGFLEFHSFLQDNGIKVAVASGGHCAHVATTLRSLGLKKVKFVGLEDVKRRKPAPDTFLLAAERIGADPSECLVFEDSLAGMQAAANANMPCIALGTTLPNRLIRGKAALMIQNYKSAKLRSLIALLADKKKDAKRRTAARIVPVRLLPGKKSAKPSLTVR
jgi:HAD superfamily hydrolase (TIGR01509 family)